MSRKTRTTVSVVEKLIEQRRLFQDWLTKLSGDVDGMPSHVVERVRNDYRARFDGVTLAASTATRCAKRSTRHRTGTTGSTGSCRAARTRWPS